MNRPIKFRIYPKDRKGEMEYNGLICEEENSVNEAIKAFQDNAWYVMQFTGFLDKNGKEIYEGDIIRFTEVDEDSCCSAEETVIGKIEWLNSASDYRCIYPSGQRRTLGSIVGCPQIYKLEVIGNIYKNENLLSDK